MNRFQLLDVDHLVIETPRTEKVRQLFISKMSFRQCPFESSELIRGKCRLKIKGPGYDTLEEDAVDGNLGVDAVNSGVDSVGGDAEQSRRERPSHNQVASETVSDVAFLVCHLAAIVEHVRNSNRDFIQRDIHFISDHPRLGPHYRAVIKSVVGNVVHTLIELDSSVRPSVGVNVLTENRCAHAYCQEDEVTTLDHIALACRIGESASILQWYEDVFQMQAFDFGEGGEGLKIQTDDLGMRLKALEYWRCSEKGLSPSKTKKQFPLLVIAEPLPGVDANNQIDVFISEHGGPGIQHFGLNTTDICHSREQMRQKGVNFIVPPPLYYQEFGKLDDIVKAGEDPSRLQRHGILIDYEDFNGANVPGHSSGYLMQVFTKPLFTKDTFFLELIERHGARGFGAGNITALFKAVQAYMCGAT